MQAKKLEKLYKFSFSHSMNVNDRSSLFTVVKGFPKWSDNAAKQLGKPLPTWVP
jgi:hypothetical protein